MVVHETPFRRAWRNWQTRMVEGHVPVSGVEVRILSLALIFLFETAASDVPRKRAGPLIVWNWVIPTSPVTSLAAFDSFLRTAS